MALNQSHVKVWSIQPVASFSCCFVWRRVCSVVCLPVSCCPSRCPALEGSLGRSVSPLSMRPQGGRRHPPLAGSMSSSLMPTTVRQQTFLKSILHYRASAVHVVLSPNRTGIRCMKMESPDSCQITSLKSDIICANLDSAVVCHIHIYFCVAHALKLKLMPFVV